MINYVRPDIYVENVANSTVVASQSYTNVASTPVIIGVFPRGSIGVPTLVNNWTEFCEAVSLGLDSPFMTNSIASNAVYGFFKNGGSRLYIDRVAGAGAMKAVGTISTGPTFTALEEGEWGNGLKVDVSIQAIGNNSIKTVTIYLNNTMVESFSDTFVTAQEDYTVLNNKVNLNSEYLNVADSKMVAGTITLVNGTSDLANISDADYTGAKGLKSLDSISDFGLVIIPGQTSNTVLQAIVDYCDGRNNCYPILDLPQGQTVSSAIASRLAVTGDKGAFYYPWLKITDPTSATGLTKIVPPSGFIAGQYAVTDKTRGMFKAPAGVSTSLNGIVGTDMSFTEDEIGQLNDNHVNALINKAGRGTVIWGARNLSSDSDKLYVPNVRLDMDIELSCYGALEWSLFEPADLNLAEKIGLSLTDVLMSKYEEGAFRGKTPSEAFYVKCDAELNTSAVLDQGMIIAEIGYAKTKPNEFTVIRIKQQVG